MMPEIFPHKFTLVTICCYVLPVTIFPLKQVRRGTPVPDEDILSAASSTSDVNIESGTENTLCKVVVGKSLLENLGSAFSVRSADAVPATLSPGLGNVWWRRSERLVFRLRLTHIESSTKRKTNTVHFSHPNYGRPVGYETTSCWQGFAYNFVLSTSVHKVGWQIQNSFLLRNVIIQQQNRFQPD